MSQTGSVTTTAYVPEDGYFGPPFVDLDEMRSQPHPHRFVHGGFTGTDTRFSLYFPDAVRYRGRFMSSLEGGVGGHETRAPYIAGDRLGTIGFAFANGAYLVESNNGHIAVGPATNRGSQDGSITTFRATAETARFARQLAREIYGERPRYGYIFGPSGGGWRTILCMENTRGIWDGAVPYLSPAGNGMSFPCAVGNLTRVLGADIRRVVDAWEPGGSGDPFAGLNTRQRAELATLYRAGLQPGAESQLLQPAFELGVLLLTSRMSVDFDPGYFEDFWALPGYAGADGELEDDLLERTTEVVSLLSAGELMASGPVAIDAIAPAARELDPTVPVGVRVAPGDARGAQGARVRVRDGAAAGRPHACIGVVGDALVLDFERVPVAGIAPGDELTLDNRDYLAYCHAYRHQIDPASPDCAQFMSAGVPIFPQRSSGVPELLAGLRTTGHFEGKMIYIANLKDTLASPVGGTIAYIDTVRRAMGAAAGDRLRVWLNDNAGHIVPARRPAGLPPVTETRIVDHDGSVEYALRALIEWVEKGAQPAPDTGFAYDDGRIVLPSDAGERRGIQPVLSATANGVINTAVRVGEPVRFQVVAQAPPGAGTLVSVEWDFDGSGTWPHRVQLGSMDARVENAVEHAYPRPGTYFGCARVALRNGGDGAAADGRVLNLARVRVEVNASCA